MGAELAIERTAKTDHTGRMPRLICVFAGHTSHFVGFVMRRLKNFVRFESYLVLVGALYLDGESGMSKLDDGIPFRHTFTYLWNITANFAPDKDDDKCVPWGYHSHVDSMKDIDTGLVGLLVVCNPGN